jgi:hypothetical protein
MAGKWRFGGNLLPVVASGLQFYPLFDRYVTDTV